jgi:hypothetical protein
MTLFRHAGTTLLALVLSATAAGAQRRGQALHARMDAFLGSLMAEGRLEPYEYFPARGSWTWFNTRDGNVGVHRFPAGETRRALDGYCPLRDSFIYQPEGQPMGGLIGRSLEHGSGWRRVRGTRFVPPGEPATSPAFVEWRREDGRWVVSAFGDESPRGRLRVPEDAPSTVRRHTTGVAESTDEGPWHTGLEPIHFDGRRWFMNGLPRVVPRDQLTLLGLLGRVPVYAEAGVRAPDVLYVAVGPGPEVAPYQTNQYRPCE